MKNKAKKQFLIKKNSQIQKNKNKITILTNMNN